ncbi:MAG: HD domain-containing protein, partial [Muribaculaceae bacterium]|nr:HD domain-containing protein [Muribaculaceae bacterium]
MEKKGLKPVEEKRDYSIEIENRAKVVFDAMRPRVSEEDYRRLVDSFEVAREAHSKQKRKTGEPYIFHPIAVATIAAQELNLDVDTVIAAFLHDVVEDTDWTVDQIQKRFGNDVAFLVRVVTKQKKEKYEMSKQLDNFKQMLTAVQYD